VDADDGLSRPDSIWHITTLPEWERALEVREIAPASLETDGFVHCSTAAQLDGVIARFYRDVPDLVVLEVDPARLTAELRWEAPAHPDGAPNTGGEETLLFPHVYGAIPTDAVFSERRR
jgi:uncharacterized protein (DUF952 family)